MVVEGAVGTGYCCLGLSFKRLLSWTSRSKMTAPHDLVMTTSELVLLHDGIWGGWYIGI